ncbi:acyl-CoA dehydrogenase [Marinobacterium mangrovicola]|uniref:3-methylmercaptopropionyl-CoA dehydrogenase n=1 Tax=Marinobacterium mangrovicola TaxID=1476959 RepID=A0A4R1G9E8_9GAMM|nr:acyl-CoA dehydrogenase [Marinobacterium mangrovicola]TCK04318.1 alkylation response protein AidB-like acyl-CoA dehydrogenase [Marinobacterium mangrovicola]
MSYQAPLDELRFLINELVDLEKATGKNDLVSDDLVFSIWEEAGRFATGVLEPLNRPGDCEGLRFEDGEVKTPAGFVGAYRQLTEMGWNSVGLPEELGGQGLPWLVSSPITEMFSSANKAFNMCAGLTQGAIEAINLIGSAYIKELYLEPMVAGRWTGTMNLTEPQAGSDVGAIRTRAIPQPDGTYRISGQKIFISFGEHDLAENIIHLVLARLPDAPEGVRGISLFLVPKFLVNDDGCLGNRNDLQCVSIEHKLGIHASPTCTLVFGDQGGATGYLLGEPNRGLAAMFVMMNAARLTVGMEGVASAEAALQKARAYAFERVQGSKAEDPSTAVAIAEHEDVRRMLMLMTSRTRAMRAMAMVIAEAQDLCESSDDTAESARQHTFVSLMTPIFKAWATESAVEVASLAIQIHGGMGFVEETGVAQIWRDSRICPIYEGTTGIQANDLVSRKLLRDKGEGLSLLVAKIRTTLQESQAFATELRKPISALEEALNSLEGCAERIIALGDSGIENIRFISVPFLMLAGNTVGGWLMLQCAVRALQARGSERYAEQTLESWRQSAEFYSRYTLAEVHGLERQVLNYLEDAAAAPAADIFRY